MAEMFTTLFTFAILIFCIKAICNSYIRKKRIALLKLKEQEQEAEEQQEQLEEAFFNDVYKIIKQGIQISDINSLITQLENNNIKTDILFEAYANALCKLMLEYLAFFCSDTQKENEIRSKIFNALDCTTYLNKLPTEEDIDYANALFSTTKEVLEKALEYNKGKPQTPSTILKANEIQKISVECIMFENSKGIEIGEIVSPYQIFQVDILPFGNYVHKDELTYKGEGILILTNKRIIFASPSVTRDFKYSDILSITAGKDGIQISRTDKVRPEVLLFNRNYVSENKIQTQFLVSILQDMLKQQI